VIVELPIGVLEPVVIVSKDDPEPVTDDGLKLPDAPAGKPFTVRVTAPLNPLTALTDTLG